MTDYDENMREIGWRLRWLPMLGIVLGFVLGLLVCVTLTDTDGHERQASAGVAVTLGRELAATSAAYAGYAQGRADSVCHTIGGEEDSDIYDCDFRDGGWHQEG